MAFLSSIVYTPTQSGDRRFDPFPLPAALLAKMKAWADEYGSDRLRRCIEEGWPYADLLEEEMAALLANNPEGQGGWCLASGGWQWTLSGAPTVEAIDLYDRHKHEAQNVRIVWLTGRHTGDLDSVPAYALTGEIELGCLRVMVLLPELWERAQQRASAPAPVVDSARPTPHTPGQREQLRALVDACGAAEVLRLLGQIIANGESDLHLGSAVLDTLYQAADRLQAAAKRDAEFA